VEHGGNKSGIPTVNGSIVFDERFLGKPLVYCGTLGLMEMEINGRKGYEKQVDIGDHILMVGGRIGKDGIHGATFSSEPLHEGSPATAVQIGDPITQKRMTDFLEYARKQNLYSSQTDNGAGGLSSSIGEMAEDTGGARVHLDRAPLKYPGLEPWEIFVSEAQERMTIAVPPHKVARFLELAKEWNVEATDLGEFTDSGVLEILYDATTVARLDMEFLHRGLPRMQLRARWTPTAENAGPLGESATLDKDIMALLARPNICSKEYVVRQYDHEVQAGSVVKPLCGVANDGPSDAGVIRPILDADVGVVVSHGIVPRYSDIDTYAMAAAAVDEAVRNAVASGADPDHMAALDNFCWCDPVQSADNPDGDYKLAQLVRAGQALYDVCVAYNMPLISGKDSMKNDYRIGNTRISIPPALLVSLIARIPNVNQAVTMDFKASGNAIYILGITKPELGASEYALHKGLSGLRVPRIDDPSVFFGAYRALHGAIRAGLVRSCHDLSDGGLAVALVEMCFAGALGASVDLSKVTAPGCSSATEVLFSESQGRILIEVAQAAQQSFEAALAGHACERIGVVKAGEMVDIAGLDGKPVVSLSHVDCKAAWKNALDFQ
jgi:phosphoribosylformylglycinamidine synthase